MLKLLFFFPYFSGTDIELILNANETNIEPDQTTCNSILSGDTDCDSSATNELIIDTSCS